MLVMKGVGLIAFFKKKASKINHIIAMNEKSERKENNRKKERKKGKSITVKEKVSSFCFFEAKDLKRAKESEN